MKLEGRTKDAAVEERPEGQLSSSEGLRPEDIVARAKEQETAGRFPAARRLYESVAIQEGVAEELRRRARQGQALCTYKDGDLPVEFRLRRALEVLALADELETTTDQETLGLAGAIHKLLWQHEARRADLERSLAYYRRGYVAREKANDGYTSINAAFTLDQLASLDESIARDTATESDVAKIRREEARRIRQSVVIEVGPRLGDEAATWWWYATVAEAQFGLGEYDSACETIKAGLAQCPPPDWHLRATTEQLAALARLQGIASTREFEASPAAQVVRALVGEVQSKAVVESGHVGKVGLALSGGGFRASLYHLGVLAKLAELDVLRRVEVLSCVSGGSILGAHWYLAVRALLQAKEDSELDRGDYIALVKWVEREFLAGVETNVRTRVAGSLVTNLRMIFTPDYSRTKRVGELYEKHLYATVPEKKEDVDEWLRELEQLKAGGELGRRTRGRVSSRTLSGLFVYPKGDDGKFKPRTHNWRRNYKVPDLILNATTLNTGHCWQFTASWMGEPPASVARQVDGNDWLRRMYYREAPTAHQNVRLGDAVAASSCVPGLFEPLVMQKLFPERTVRLVDGGVHDNQGIVGLFDQGCQVLLVSDASGQMGSIADPSPGLVGVPLRANGILMSRVRTEQFKTLASRDKAGLMRGMMFIHMREGLEAQPVSWVGCKDTASQDHLDHAPRPVVNPESQALVSEIRTDLDSFSEAEAFSLMTLGYRMTERAFAESESLKGFPVEAAQRDPVWRFLAVEKDLEKSPSSTLLGHHLRVGRSKAFRAWHLVRWLKILAAVLGLVALGGAVWLVQAYWSTRIETRLGRDIFAPLLSAIGLAVAGAIIGKWIVRIANVRSTFQRIGLGVAFGTVGWVLAIVHVNVFDRFFVYAGRAKNVISKPHP